MRSDAWSDIAAHRERLLRIARRRCPTREDAEDVVSEAMLRCATFEGLDESRLEQFLTAVVVRLCADQYRKAERRGRALVKLVADPDVTPGPEEELLGGVDALVLEDLLASLPERQRSVLFDRANGLSVTQIATRNRLTYKAAESALARARGAMRAALASALGAIAAFARGVRPKRAAAALALPAVTLMAATTVLHLPLLDGDGPYAAPREVPFTVDELPHRTTPATAPMTNVSNVTTAPAHHAAPAAPTTKPPRKSPPKEINVGNDDDVVHATVREDAGWSPERFVQQCMDDPEPWITVEPRPQDPEHPLDVYQGCGGAAAGQ